MTRSIDAPASAAASTARLVYLDVLRGVAVLIMVLAHVVDSWTRETDRHDFAYYTAVFIGGLGAPLFLLLAGTAQVMSAAAKARRAGSLAAGRRAMWQRGWEVFALAWLFRVQSQLLGWGALTNLLKVDILNVMGLSMVITSLLWGRSVSRARRIGVLALATALTSFATPIVRALPWLAGLPDPVAAYLRPAGDYAAFSLLPWAGFLFAGGIIGELIDATRANGRAPVLQLSLGISGSAATVIAWWASFRPSIYASASFWSSSPTFFFIKLGMITAAIPAIWAHCAFWLAPSQPDTRWVEGRRDDPSSPSLIWRPGIAATRAVELLGRSSLFVYWIHVEMVYGVIAGLVKRELPLWGSLIATLMLCGVLVGIVRLKNRWLEGVTLPPRARIFAAVLK